MELVSSEGVVALGSPHSLAPSPFAKGEGENGGAGRVAMAYASGDDGRRYPDEPAVLWR